MLLIWYKQLKENKITNFLNAAIKCSGEVQFQVYGENNKWSGWIFFHNRLIVYTHCRHINMFKNNIKVNFT